MAYTEAQLKAISDSNIATGQTPPIPAVKHRVVNNALIQELFDFQGLANRFAGLTELGSPASDDQIFVIRGGVAYLIDASTLDFVQQLTDLSDVNIVAPANDAIVYWNESEGKFKAKVFDAFSVSVQSVVTTGGAITLNFDGQVNRKFVGATSFAAPKTIAYSNAGFANEYTIMVEVTDIAAVITFPAGTISNAAGWSSLAWTPSYTGKFKFKADYDGTSWWLEVNEAFN